MPKLATPLSDIKVKNAKAQPKPYRLADGLGLYLLVNTDGARYWRMDYRLYDRRNTLAFGRYPEITLANARDQRTAARELIRNGIDPSHAKRSGKTKISK